MGQGLESQRSIESKTDGVDKKSRKKRKMEGKELFSNHNCVVVVSDTLIINTYVLDMPRERYQRPLFIMGKTGFVVSVHLWLDYFSLLPEHRTRLPSSAPLLSSNHKFPGFCFLYSKPGYIRTIFLNKTNPCGQSGTCCKIIFI